MRLVYAGPKVYESWEDSPKLGVQGILVKEGAVTGWDAYYRYGGTVFGTRDLYSVCHLFYPDAHERFMQGESPYTMLHALDEVKFGATLPPEEWRKCEEVIKTMDCGCK